MFSRKGWSAERGMSKRAVDAYKSGKKPLSKLTAKDLALCGVPLSLGFARYLARRRVWDSCEWHHTAKYFNCTNFYDPTDLRELAQIDAKRLLTLLADYKAERATKKVEGVRVVGEYAIWGGSRSRPKILRWEPFEGVKVGAWINLPDGTRKKAAGGWIRFSEVNLINK